MQNLHTPLHSCRTQSARKLFSTCALLLTSALGFCGQAHAGDTFAGMEQSRDRTIRGAALLGKEGYAYDNVTPFSLAFIDRGSYSSISTRLERGVRYAILGVGDDDAADVDVIIQDGAGNLIAQDVDKSATAIASLTPKYGGNYTIFLKLHSSRESVSVCSLSIFRKTGGYVLTGKSLKDASDNIITLGETMKDKYDIVFHNGTGQWAVVGTILQEGGTSTFSGIPTLTGTYAFLAVGDEDMESLNMEVHDINGTLLDEDKDNSALAACVKTFNSRQTCSVKVINAKSSDYSLVLRATLHD